jgi:guanidinopropionase
VTFEVDSIDPAIAPGTGTPEIGGFTIRVAQEMVRRLDGAKIIGVDVVEVMPPFDICGQTARAGVRMMFELVCAMAAMEKHGK